MMGKLQTKAVEEEKKQLSKMNVSGQVYEEPLTFQAPLGALRAHIFHASTLLTSWNLIMTPSLTHQQQQNFV